MLVMPGVAIAVVEHPLDEESRTPQEPESMPSD